MVRESANFEKNLTANRFGDQNGGFVLLKKFSVFDHNMSRDRVVFQRIHRHVLAVPGMLQAPMGHLIHQHEMCVDPSAAIAKPGSSLHSPAHVTCPD